MATDDVSLSPIKAGHGGFGTVYKGKLPNGLEIAVKRLSRDSGQGDMEFKNEVLLLAKLQHKYLVRLLGFVLEGMEKVLVYEFVQNASLDNFIFVKHLVLDWEKRYKIIGGIARGILYLHEDSRLRNIHRDLKASNILLDNEMRPKIADFGMARLFRQDETHGNTSRIEDPADRPTMASVVPSEPAFYAATGYGSDASLIHNSDSSYSHHNTSSRQTQQSHRSSQNDMSIADLYPC
ncbi:hypothetical protein SASPL_135113 [Salvia splendens]|uniref:non-specific serine/threonine protein kinase n=1 Tax=Salvia splendens TaxID=180675 RepID=A0A8X8ZGB4_SALSN|nr:hypothetical protein SASPL_135113 [Salvia splendens]